MSVFKSSGGVFYKLIVTTGFGKRRANNENNIKKITILFNFLNII